MAHQHTKGHSGPVFQLPVKLTLISD